MKARRVVPRTLANQDVQAAIDFYLQEANDRVALQFIDALETAYGRIARHPATGLTRYAHALGLPELRNWPLSRFPYLVFYVEREDHIDVWRVLHQQRDIPVWLDES